MASPTDFHGESQGAESHLHHVKGSGAGEAKLRAGELATLVRRLRLAPPFFRHYGRWKVRLDPAYPLILARIGGAKEVLDLGAGMGLVEALFAGRFPEARIRGVEWDERKVEVARSFLAGLPGATVEQGDARDVAPGSPDAILLIDVLHYWEPEVQKAMLERCAKALAVGGVLVVRELHKSESRQSASERIERIAVGLGWNRGAGVRILPVEAIASLLRGLGMGVEVRQSGRGIFAANVLIVASKPISQVPQGDG